MTARTTRFVFAFTSLTLTACGGGGIRNTSSISDGDWKPVAEGQSVVLYAAGAGCASKVAKTKDELLSGAGTTLSDTPWAKSASAWTVKSSQVDDRGKEEPNLLLELEKAGSNERQWLYSKEALELSCVYPALPGVREADAALGKSFSWAPWKLSCGEIVAGGSAFPALVQEPPNGAAHPAQSVTLGRSGPLVNLSGGSLLVTPDTLRDCFAEVGTPDAALPALGALAYLRVPSERCDSEKGVLTTHVACRSTVGAWQQSDAGLRGVRRTLGPIHFVDSKPVTGKNFARAVVAIDTGRATSARETTLYASIRNAASELINRGDDSVRIAPLGDAAVTTNVKISIRDVTIGELRTARSKPTSRYIVRQEQVRNSAKDSMRADLERAERLLNEKRSECDSMPSTDFSASQACVDRCVAQNGGLAAATCGFTCRDAGGGSSAKNSCNERINSVEQDLQRARNVYASEPDTITNTVYGDWSYERIDYTRKVSAVIQTDSGSSQGQKHATDPLEFEATDYEVVADSSHNVEGHTARRDFIDSPDSILPNLAQRASDVAIKRLREALSQGAIDAALRALAASGGSAKTGYETVDAMAFDVVGKRLIKAERYGDASTPAGNTLPTAELALAPGECALAVAASQDTTGEVSLTTDDQRFADVRKRPFATLEICAGEFSAAKTPATQVAGPGVRWAVYRTRAQAK